MTNFDYLKSEPQFGTFVELHVLMSAGIKIGYGEKHGKTIIFVKNHAHAEKIYEVFHREYPHLPNDYANAVA